MVRPPGKSFGVCSTVSQVAARLFPSTILQLAALLIAISVPRLAVHPNRDLSLGSLSGAGAGLLLSNQGNIMFGVALGRRSWTCGRAHSVVLGAGGCLVRFSILI